MIGRKSWFRILVANLLCLTPGLTHSAPGRAHALPQVDGLVRSLMDDWKVPGVALVVVRDGTIDVCRGFGFRDLGRRWPVSPATLFPIASCTKTFTAVSLGLLVGDGLADWDVPVREYCPSLRFFDENLTACVTLRDLLSHRSGMPQHYRMYSGRTLTRKDIVDRLRFLEPSRDFRGAFQYSNLNYAVAAFILERITGKPWEDFVRERILEPLDMTATNFSARRSQAAEDHAVPCREDGGRAVEVPVLESGDMGMGPAGAVVSNARDMANWVLFHLEKGRRGDRVVLPEGVLREIHTPQMTMPGPASEESFYSFYGLGLGISSYRGKLILSHGGAFDGFSAFFSFMPLERIGIVVLTNLESSPLPVILARTLYDRLLGLPEIPWSRRMKDRLAGKGSAEPGDSGARPGAPCRLLDDYCGTFEHPAYGILAISKEGDRLKAVHNGLPASLMPQGCDVFVSDPAFGRFRWLFQSGATGAVASVQVDFEPAGPDIRFARKT